MLIIKINITYALIINYKIIINNKYKIISKFQAILHCMTILSNLSYSTLFESMHDGGELQRLSML